VAANNPVKYYFQKNHGVSSAKNRGIGVSQGAFFICLDADDRLFPKYVEKTLNQILKRVSTGFVYTGSVVWNESIQCEDIWMPRKLLFKYSLFGGWHGAIGPILVRRQAFDSLEQGFDPTFSAYEDMDLCFRILSNGWKADLVDEPIHWYRVHPNSLNPITTKQRRMAEANIDRKFWFRPTYRRLYTCYTSTFGRLISLLKHPAGYLRCVKKKIQINVLVKSLLGTSSVVTVRGINKELKSSVDRLDEWYQNRFLREYYTQRIEMLLSILTNLS
jgi:glycosyltransferase involved in cell wall biosynthesis